MFKTVGFMLGVLVLAAACGGADSSNLRSGVTVCGSAAVTCQAGQYCSDARFAECSVGCLSNDNCASDQTCVAAVGSSVGSCTLPSNTPTMPGSMQPHPGSTPAQGCGDNICTDAERNTCRPDCGNLLDTALGICDSYDFFACFGPGELQTCYDQVTRATVAQRQQFANCGTTATVDCKNCRQYLPQ